MCAPIVVSSTPTPTPTQTPTPSPLCVLEDFDEAYVGVTQAGLPLPNNWTGFPSDNVGVFASYPSLSSAPGAYTITPFYGPKFAYLLSGDADVYTTLSATINVANVGLEFVSYVFFDTFDVNNGDDDAFEAVVSLTPPSNSTTVLYSITGADVAYGNSYSYDHGGQTGWVRVQYTFTEAGTHVIEFGVRSRSDDFYRSALAVVRAVGATAGAAAGAVRPRRASLARTRASDQPAGGCARCHARDAYACCGAMGILYCASLHGDPEPAGLHQPAPHTPIATAGPSARVRNIRHGIAACPAPRGAGWHARVLPSL